MVTTLENTAVALDFTQIVKISFQPESSPLPEGFVKDNGAAYKESRGFGWLREDSLNNPIPLAIATNTRERKQTGLDSQFNTLIHMQYPVNASSPKGVKIPAAWQCNLPNGIYNVTVCVGDPTAIDSIHQINIANESVIAGFVPTKTRKFFVATKRVTITDGKLTLDAKGGTNTKLNYVEITPGDRPSIRHSSLAPNEIEISTRNVPLTAEVNLIDSGIDPSTVSTNSIKLFETLTGRSIAATPNTSGGGDVISLTVNGLKPKTKYTFEVTEQVKDLNGLAFLPYSMSFVTNAGEAKRSDIVFEQIQPTAPAKPYSSVTIGPDGKLYAATLTGEIVRFSMRSDGQLENPQVITSVQMANDGPRSIIGMAFDPAATADQLILWISNNFFWTGESPAPEWSGKITRLSGPDLETVQDYVVDLPRSTRDHMTNSIAFKTGSENNPVLYVLQGSNSAMGAFDNAWRREEQLLTAAVLQIDPTKIPAPPLSVKTGDGGTYDPFAPEAAVTIYASGIRNAYDLVWHSNDRLYVPANGSAAGGNTPGTPDPFPDEFPRRIDGQPYTGPAVPKLTNVSAQRDYLFQVEQGGYYGHPNPQRSEWVMNGGNHASSPQAVQVQEYPTGTAPDQNYRGIAFDFGLHRSPNGAIEYKSNVFDNQLKGKLLVVRYSAGDDIIVLAPMDTNPGVVEETEITIEGFTGFDGPLDLIENPANGNLYVVQFNEQSFEGKITLLRPKPAL